MPATHSMLVLPSTFSRQPDKVYMHIMCAGMKGCNAEIHAAAKVEMWGDYALFREAADGTRTVVEAAKAAGVPRFVHVGTKAVLVKVTRSLLTVVKLPSNQSLASGTCPGSDIDPWAFTVPFCH